MKRAIYVIVCLLFFVGVANAQHSTIVRELKDSIRQLEQRLTELEDEVDSMGQVTVPGDLDAYQDENPPDIAGDLKIVKGTLLELDDADSDAQWALHSGVGTTLEVNEINQAEGTGCIQVNIPASTTAIVEINIPAGSWDLSTYKYLKAYLKVGGHTTTIPNCNMHFTEDAATYNQQSRGVFTATLAWVQISWDISAIAAASRNAVTQVSFTIPNTHGYEIHALIDFLIADPGPSLGAGYDGDKVYYFWPKVYTSHYHGTGVDDLQIDIARKGTPSRIQIDGMVTRTILWTTDMAAGHSKRFANDTADYADVTDGIKSVGDCYFTVGTAAQVNTNGTIYHYTIWWDD